MAIIETTISKRGNTILIDDTYITKDPKEIERILADIIRLCVDNIDKIK